ncbi:uncharacterized serine-rich protein C215.13 [Tetranychus urticae]|uniref:Uncharacterized protein n=1 Tax=Tetranychus urticae TaxID=32264 RepID=T1KPI7_TETUR|nr:uncharacterized serine-rich protein C215.13 [Tetranychus urticae]XP_015789353.1 uncharacterized serine-rich protein C215.13 [Tetranychus urticae]XP_015789354.1 uncharacterized serine-rich protein C215.13 [Tetranychus urticae]XP_025017429.1 uncharacterized serine-rich protein C215.13 [Tetranychus urticae]
MVANEMDYESDLDTHKRRESCCSNCESQIFCSYVISILSSSLIAGGIYLAILKWDHLWLILPIVGCILIFIGACMYYSGQMDLKRRRNHKASSASHVSGRRRIKRGNKDRSYGDNLISSTLGDGRSLSQLSINMIPQYFANSDLPGSTGPASMPYSQIFRVNGQSFLILPLNGETSTNPNETAISLQNLMVKVPCKNDQQSKPESSDIYKKMEDFTKRFVDHKIYASTEGSLPSSSVSHDGRLIGLDNRATGVATGLPRDAAPGSHSESHFTSNYFCAPSTSTSFNTCQPEAQTSRVNNCNLRVDPGSIGSTNTNQPSSYIQQSLPTSSTSSTSSSSGPSSSSRRPLLRRDTFNKGKPSVTIVSTTNSADPVHAQTTAITKPSTSSSVNNRSDNCSSASNSLRLHSSQPGSAGSSVYPQTAAEGLVITQSNLSSTPNITPSSATVTINSPNSTTSAGSDRQRAMDQCNNPDETFITMCGGNGSDVDNLTFDETLIETGSATPPPSYEEVLSVDITGPGAELMPSSSNFDTL